MTTMKEYLKAQGKNRERFVWKPGDVKVMKAESTDKAKPKESK